VQVVILCGGRGRRAYPLTEDLPKPMLPIGGTPMLVHLMRFFADQGHSDFVLSVGYRQDVIRDYFRHRVPGWRVTIVDTGEDADTGERVSRCRHVLEGTFFATYGDGLADVSLASLLAFHTGHGGLVTLTTVPLPCQYGTVEADTVGRVRCFREKPILSDHWINAGFMVMDTAALDRWSGTSLERDVLPSLSSDGVVYAYRHAGFFRSLDSHKDQQELDALARNQPVPWRRGSTTSA
jgi:glucose-1-phosphate cytidylyltransferase